MKALRLAAIALGLDVASAALACDTCGLYCPAESSISESARGFTFGLSSQYTRQATLLDRGLETNNPSGEYLNSSMNQLFVGYDLSERFGLQMNVPVLARSFRRVEAGQGVHRSTSGVGDLLFFANATPLRHSFGRAWVQWRVQAGLKLPTGSTQYLEEESFHGHNKPSTSQSAIHGRDVTLGSGSFDGIFGTDLSARYKSVYFTANVQYARRGTGAIEYRFGDDFNWRGGPGVRLQRRDLAVGVQALLSGEAKSEDVLLDVVQTTTGRSAVYLGPLVTVAWKRLGGEFGVGVPLHIEQHGYDVVPDWRLRLGVNWQLR